MKARIRKKGPEERVRLGETMTRVFVLAFVGVLLISAVPAFQMARGTDTRDVSISAPSTYLTTTGSDNETVAGDTESFTIHVENDYYTGEEWTIGVNVTVPADFTLVTANVYNPTPTNSTGSWSHVGNGDVCPLLLPDRLILSYPKLLGDVQPYLETRPEVDITLPYRDRKKGTF